MARDGTLILFFQGLLLFMIGYVILHTQERVLTLEYELVSLKARVDSAIPETIPVSITVSRELAEQIYPHLTKSHTSRPPRCVLAQESGEPMPEECNDLWGSGWWPQGADTAGDQTPQACNDHPILCN